MVAEQWTGISEELRYEIGESNHKNWIEPLECLGVSDGVVRFRAPSRFVGDWVKRTYHDQIFSRLQTIGTDVTRMEFIVGEPAQRPATATATAASTVNKSGAGDELQGAPLDGKYNFDNFVVGKPNELAHAAARRVAEGGPVTFNPLFLYGGVGLGKTHLMHAIAWELKAKRPDLQVLYLSAEQFMYRFVQALRDREIMDFKNLFRSVDVLMVDDVQFIAGKDSTQEEFFHTFNALVDQNKQIVISADRAPGEIKDLEARISSRMQCGLVVDLHPTNYELRLGILHRKAAQFAQSYGSIKIDDGVFEFLAHRITTNVRVLEGALQRLFAFSSLIGQEVSQDMVQDCLSDMLRSSERRVTVEEIQRKVAEHFNIRLSDMLGPKRTRTIARPRQIAMYLSKEMTSRSLPEIGRRFGGRDHTTILHGVRKVVEMREQDTQLNEDIELLRRLLES
ncbi:chromosomal replication initiator protein DnaA [Roseinatronobacter bogoriensis]|uniref:Chromosomal replication initiator protein DnaA n=1 Tax=Roseinatronobacter bogoriensis subsp. barguzinensis TaxID=441209 RepID=A0A2K8K4M3_9RHOB|nr:MULTISPECIES: chromosomal replication initiator protein DnaA [Rhodobaca]ATX64411.1 chromosomal replication initiator protein DnaA [Rhodobaca barguzinensis]MBB4209114.1 chromosomal replication initiator protein [Rhodobaca bogoriensis DSM 18756]TDW36358.1 chromosomal replication initiator protein DnaA [Rhodobaca barguzinensis]TDY67514.1 chromosomal replication initiator protein DnaA [Rhodobaca bogoriensis DSM 18756]